MFWWKKKAKGALSSSLHAPRQALTAGGSDDAVKKLARRKEVLFYTWLTDNYGEEEGQRLYRAALWAMDFNRSLYEWGDFSRARGYLLNIAVDLPDAGKMPASGYEEEPKLTPAYAMWLNEWCEAYPESK